MYLQIRSASIVVIVRVGSTVHPNVSLPEYLYQSTSFSPASPPFRRLALPSQSSIGSSCVAVASVSFGSPLPVSGQGIPVLDEEAECELECVADATLLLLEWATLLEAALSSPPAPPVPV